MNSKAKSIIIKCVSFCERREIYGKMRRVRHVTWEMVRARDGEEFSNVTAMGTLLECAGVRERNGRQYKITIEEVKRKRRRVCQ